MRTIGLLGMITVVILIGGCVITPSSGTNPDENYRTGSTGLSVSFLTNTPPSKLYDDEDFKAMLEIRNIGATDVIANGRLYLSGFDPSIITGIDSSGFLIQDLEGKSLYNPEGGYDVATFDGHIRDLESRQVDYYDVPILATACYAYETIAAPTLCLDPDPYSNTRETKACSAGSVENVGGSQGGPVAVTSVTVEPSPGKAKIKFDISNVGGGTVIRSGLEYLTRCNPYSTTKLEYEDVDYVKIEEVQIGDQTITGSCKPVDNEHIRLHNGKGFVWCEVTGLMGSAYKTPLTIKLSYNYRSTTERNIRIVQTP